MNCIKCNKPITKYIKSKLCRSCSHIGLKNALGYKHTKSACKKISKAGITHGDSIKGKMSYLYYTWDNIRSRCFNPNNKKYKHYGARGITMYHQWRYDYTAFKEYILSTIGHRPKNHSLDRIDNDGNYEPGNLRWATPKQQVKNSRVCLSHNS